MNRKKNFYDPANERRVVVTGLGAVTPVGLTVEETWNALVEGRSGVVKISQFDASLCPTQIAGEIKNFDPHRTFGPFHPNPKNAEHVITEAVSKKDLKKMGRFIQIALVAGLEAYKDSGLDSVRKQIAPDRIGVNIGVGMGGLGEIQEVHLDFLAKGFKRITPFFIPEVIANLASGHLSILLDLQGPNVCNITACSSSAHSLGESFHLIKRGDADLVLSGGSESVVSQLAVGGFAAMKALSTRNDAPEKASRPFDVDRDGFILAEGAAVLVLEEYEHAKKRGAKIYGELVGYGLSGDAYHMTLPAPEGAGGYRAMKMALERADLQPEDIGYINAHGTSTPSGDVEEARAISRLFPNASSHLHVSSTKSMTGHLLGAAGAVEGLISLLSVKNGVIPPTINLDRLDPECEKLGINFTPNTAVKKKFNYALSNSFGFGGTNACVIFGRV